MIPQEEARQRHARQVPCCIGNPWGVAFAATRNNQRINVSEEGRRVYDEYGIHHAPRLLAA